MTTDDGTPDLTDQYDPMSKTERLYYTDCYLQEFDARVLEVHPDPRGVRVILDRSAFYPESGGQPKDLGTLDGAPLLDVLDQGDTVPLVVAEAPAGPTVHGAIDWTCRFDHMQQHTGQHVLSAAFQRVARAKTVGFHMGADVSSIDLESDLLGRRQLDEVEELANRVVFENREVRILFRTAREASSMDLRKPTERQGDVRLIEVDGFDLSACGGTHVGRTGAIGLVATRRFERLKGNTRVEFVCGARALRAARRDFLALGEAGRALSGSPDQVPALVVRQSEELRGALRAREKLIGRLAEYRARELAQGAPEIAGRRIIRHVFAADDLAEAKMIAHAVEKLPSTVALVGVGPQGPASARAEAASPSGTETAGKRTSTTLFFSQSAGGEADMGALLKRTMAEFQGRGGGTRDFAQGGGIPEDKLEAALAYATGLV